MRLFVDLHLCPQLENYDQTRQMIEKSARLGYKAVGIAFPPRAPHEEIVRIDEVCKSVGADLVKRIDLNPRNPKDLLRNLRTLRREAEVISVQCYSKAVARQAAKDRRVDLVMFPSTDPRRRFFDSAEAELASEAFASVEFDMSPLIYLRGFRRVRLISALRKEVSIATKFDVPIVLSSGADDVTLLRKPEDYAALCYLFGLDSAGAKQAFSENPRTIVERNRRKLSPEYVAPGVHVVRRGKDCSSV